METSEGEMSGTLGPGNILTGLQGVAELSRKKPGMVWTRLAHHIDLGLLKEAYRHIGKDGAAGVDLWGAWMGNYPGLPDHPPPDDLSYPWRA
jgi:hypothetical protein